MVLVERFLKLLEQDVVGYLEIAQERVVSGGK